MASFGLEVFKTVDPRVDFEQNKSKNYVFVEPANQIVYREYPANAQSNNALSWNIPMSATGVGLGRSPYVKLGFTLTWPGQADQNAAKALLHSDENALRAYPLSSIIQNAAVTINNTTFNNPISELIHGFSRFYNSSVNKQRLFSMTPSAIDPYQTYAQAKGTNANPLGVAANRTLDGVQPRSFFNPVFTTTATTLTMTVTVCEYIFVSPFVWNPDNIQNSLSFYGVNNLQIELNFVSNLAQRLFSSGQAGLATPVVTIGQSYLYLQNYTPQPNQLVPKINMYPNFIVDRMVTSSNATVNVGASVNIISQNINLSGIPNAVYVWAVRNVATQTIGTTDTFLSLADQKGCMNVQLGNTVNIFSSLGLQDLYLISVRNGLAMSYQDFNGQAIPATPLEAANATNNKNGQGSVFKFTPSDTGGDFMNVSGSASQKMTLQVNATFVNNNPVENLINPVMYVVVVYEGIVTIADGTCVQNINILSQSDIINAKSKKIDFSSYNRIFGSGKGGSVFDNLGSFFTGTLPSALQTWLPLLKSGVELGSMVGLGNEEEGGSLVGGKSHMSVNNLRNRLRNM